MPSQREISEQQHEEAVRVLRAEYYQSVRALVDEGMNEIREGRVTSAEELNEWLEQSIDGSYWVIYTHANMQVIFVSDNDDAYMEDFGEAPVEGGNINWAALAYAAMRRDVFDLVGAYDAEIEELLSRHDVDAPRRARATPGRPPQEAPRRRSSTPRKKAPRKKPSARKKSRTRGRRR